MPVPVLLSPSVPAVWLDLAMCRAAKIPFDDLAARLCGPAPAIRGRYLWVARDMKKWPLHTPLGLQVALHVLAAVVHLEYEGGALVWGYSSTEMCWVLTNGFGDTFSFLPTTKSQEDDYGDDYRTVRGLTDTLSPLRALVKVYAAICQSPPSPARSA